MNILIHINTDNAAFDNNEARYLSHLLTKLSTTFEDEGIKETDGYHIMDFNGNTVGNVEVTNK